MRKDWRKEKEKNWRDVEIKGRAEKKRGWSSWEKERKKFFRDTGVEVGKAERKEGGLWEEVEKKEREMQEKERWGRIGSSRYNRWYRRVKGKGVSEYLKKGWGERGESSEV